MEERKTVLAARLKDEMEREADLFKELGLEIEKLRDSFQDKEWTASLTLSQGIERFAQKIQSAEAARDAAFVSLKKELGCPEATAFTALLPVLPVGNREMLEGSYRKLRSSVIRLKTATGRLRYSAEALAGALNRILEGVFPLRKGKIYSRKGKPTDVTGSLLIDRKM
jgi:hypothetical protein